MAPNYIDVHAHISFPEYDKDRDEILVRMREAGVAAINVGVDLKSSQAAVAFAERHNDIVATIGLHPRDNTKEVFDSTLYEKLVENSKVVGIGECGLDYYRIDEWDIAEKKRQQDEFEKQVAFAIKHDKPLMLHCRPQKGTMDAYEEALGILRIHAGSHLRGNVHFFVGTPEIARQFYEINFTTSFPGVITFSSDYDAVIKEAPISMLLSETDSPFAAPLPHRGKRNEPVYVREVVKRIATLRGENVQAVEQTLVQNAVRVFNLPFSLNIAERSVS